MTGQVIMESPVRFVVYGLPQSQGAMRRNPYGKGMHDANPNLGSWRADLVHAAMVAWGERPRLIGAVEITATFLFPRLRSHYGTGRNAEVLKESAPLAHTTKPDLDHLQRAVGDALTVAGVIRDDSQICSWAASKIYGERPGCMITIDSVDGAKRYDTED